MKWESRENLGRSTHIIIVGRLKISVVYNHVFCPDQWIFSCSPFFEYEELGNCTEKQAKETAVSAVKSALREMLGELDNGKY